MLHQKAKCHQNLILREQKEPESLIYSQCASLLFPSASHVPAKKEQRQGGGVQESSDWEHQPAHLHCQAPADHAERYFSTQTSCPAYNLNSNVAWNLWNLWCFFFFYWLYVIYCVFKLYGYVLKCNTGYPDVVSVIFQYYISIFLTWVSHQIPLCIVGLMCEKKNWFSINRYLKYQK